METPILTTERMILRPLRITDAEDIYGRWTSDDRVSKYMRWCTHANVSETEAWLEQEVSAVTSDTIYQWGFTLKENGYLFGGGGINFNEKEEAFELGYNIMYSYWNQGYTTEAAREILRFADEALHQNKFVSCHALENPASGAVMKKCGFVYDRNEIHMKFDGVTSYEAKKYILLK